MKLFKRLYAPLTKNEAILPSKILSLPTITITGNREITIEQKYKLLAFSDRMIQLQCEDGIVQINGNSFMIKLMYPNEIILEGNIDEVRFLS